MKTALGGVEVTTLRRDGAYRDHRRPESVTFTGSLEEDLRRRDFTVNTFAADRTGRVLDPLNGRADLEAGVLRCVGDPDRRFTEDALRILRGLRFAAQLGFRIEPETAAAIRRNRELLGGHRPGADLDGAEKAPDRGLRGGGPAGVPGGDRRLLAGAPAHGGL